MKAVLFGDISAFFLCGYDVYDFSVPMGSGQTVAKGAGFIRCQIPGLRNLAITLALTPLSPLPILCLFIFEVYSDFEGGFS